MPRTACRNSGFGGIVLDLAPQPVDLHVDRAFVDAAVAVGQRRAHWVERIKRVEIPYPAANRHDDEFALDPARNDLLVANKTRMV